MTDIKLTTALSGDTHPNMETVEGELLLILEMNKSSGKLIV